MQKIKNYNLLHNSITCSGWVLAISYTFYTITNKSVYKKNERAIFTPIFISTELIFTSMHGYVDLKVLKVTVVDGIILHNLPNHIFSINRKKTLKCVDVTINHDQKLS